MKWILELHIEIKSYLIMEWLCRHCSLMAHLVGGWGNEDWVGILHPLQQGSIIFGCFRYVLIVTKGHNWTKNAGANIDFSVNLSPNYFCCKTFLDSSLIKGNKKWKKQISNSVWRVQHPNTGQNIQQWCVGAHVYYPICNRLLM